MKLIGSMGFAVVELREALKENGFEREQREGQTEG